MTDILIIDDDETFGELLTERLESTGWDVKFHCGPFGTLNALRAAAPRVAVLDVFMPALSGIRLAELVHKTPGLEHTKLMLMSSMDQEQLDKVAKEHAVDAALNKGCDRWVMISTLRRLMEGRREPVAQ